MGRLLLLGGTIFVLGTLFTKVVLAQGEDGFISDDNIVEELAPPYEQQYTYTTPKCCNNPTIQDVAYLLVSTMDGKLLALDIANEGNTVWETDRDGQPLLAGTLGSMPPIITDDKTFSLVPALDGSLYMYSIDDRLLEPIPLNADMLLQASVKIGHDAVAGGKIVTTTGIDPITGKIRYHCGTAACETSDNDLPSSTLVFRRISNSVRAVDALTGNERWNLSVAEYEASLVLDRMNSASYTDNPSRFGFLFQPPDGIITARDACGNVLWSRSVGGHIAKTWLLENAQLNELSLFDSANIQSVSPLRNNADSWFYLGTVNHEPFIMHSKAAKNELRRLAKYSLDVNEINHAPGTQLMRALQNVFEVQDTTLDGLLSLSYRQSFSGQRNTRSSGKELAQTSDRQMQVVSRSAGSCSNSDSVALIGEKDMRRAALRDFEMPDEGWFVMKPRTPLPSHTVSRFSKPVQCAANFVRKIEAKFDSAWTVSLSIGLVSIFSVVAGVAASFGIVKYRKRNNVALPQLVTAVSVESTKSTSDSRKTAETRSTSCGPSVAGISRSSEISVTPINRQRRSTTSRTSSSEPFESKFLIDFDPLCCLGRGGFGVVFKAKHMLDEADYAVKRIAVANNDKSIERVLREVRAMAKLEHNGIIRYYHTWIERPPKGWQEETDRDLLKRLKGKNAADQEIENEVESLVEEICDIIEAPSKVASNISETTSDFSLSKDDDSSEGSWAEPSGAIQQHKPRNFLGDSSSGSESDNESSDSAAPNNGECSDSIIFGQTLKNIVKKEDSVSIAFVADLKVDSASKSKDNISNLGTELVLATTVDEDLLATTSTSSHVYLYIQMQLCQERTLHSWLSKHRNIQDRPLEKMKSWLAQLCSAVGYIHSQKLIHRDLKPQNIFFSCDDNLKVGDLGLVTKCMANGEYPEVPHQNEVSHHGTLHTDNVGTRSYMSPEQLQNKAYDLKVDVFSLGLIYCELIVPLKTVMERSIALKNLQSGILPDVLKNYNEEERDMISWMTKINPEDRPTCEEILCHEYLNSVQRFERKRYSSEK